MSAATQSQKPQLNFYVEEEGDDFTFYVKDIDGAIKAELKKLFKSARPEADEPSTGERVSVAERVYITNLILTEDGIKIGESFWPNLKAAAPNSSYQYLSNLLLVGPASQSLNKFSNGTDQQRDRKEIESAILKVLNDAINGVPLANQSWANNRLEGLDKDYLDKLDEGLLKTRWQNRFILRQAFPDLIKSRQTGRGLICSSYIGDYLSITFRKISDDHGYTAGDYRNKQHKRKENLFSLSEYCELLFREVFERTRSVEHAQGLLVITGATKSAKSEITRGVIQRYLDASESNDRRHHLVTFEDPVERFFAFENLSSPFSWAAVKFGTKDQKRDYTPREKPTDVKLLDEALADALRQTPRVFFVGETQEKADWRVLLEFAATGHLIVTTAHAGSLVEAMHKIFEAVRVKTAADRNEVAAKLLGVINIRASAELKFETPVNNETAVLDKGTNILFPALWRRSPRGVASLTSDGLASLLPHRPRQQTQAATQESYSDGPSCLGRRSLMEQLFTDANDELLTFFNNDNTALAAFQNKAYLKSIEWDLQGV